MVLDALSRGLRRCETERFKNGVTVRCRCGALCCGVPCGACARLGVNEPDNPTNEPDEPLVTPSEPTQAKPGSPEKIEVMRQRVERGESPFHPDDETRPLEPRDLTDVMS